MPKATVTIRELKNKDTGIDLSVTSYREIPGLMRSTFEYQIVVVSSLSCFKLPSHKESDVVQFTLFKKFPDFEELRTKLNEAFCGTALPPLVKKSIIVNEAVIKERRNNLDAFVKFLSATPRVVTCTHVLTFLGVDAQKAKRFSSGEAEGLTQQEDRSQEEKDGESRHEGMTSSSLFDDEDEEEEGADFLSAANSARPSVPDDDDNLFSMSDSQSSTSRGTRLFDSQDLKRELTEDDEKEFAFIPDAIITKREVISATAEDTHNDLFQVDEDIDFDKLLTLETGTEQKEASPPPPQAKPRPQPAQKPPPPVKPKPASKPAVTSPKPSIPSKPGVSPSDEAPSASPSKPAVPERPKPAPRKLKPVGGESKGAGEGASKGSSGTASAKPELSSDDIMKYIAANAEEDDADLDLFS